MKLSTLVVSAALLAPGLVLAANAQHPYTNIDPRVDVGNDTGDSQVDRLNSQQLGDGFAPNALSDNAGYPPGAPNGYAMPYDAAPAYAAPSVYAYGRPVLRPRPYWRRRFAYGPRYLYWRRY